MVFHPLISRFSPMFGFGMQLNVLYAHVLDGIGYTGDERVERFATHESSQLLMGGICAKGPHRVL